MVVFELTVQISLAAAQPLGPLVLAPTASVCASASSLELELLQLLPRESVASELVTVPDPGLIVPERSQAVCHL